MALDDIEREIIETAEKEAAGIVTESKQKAEAALKQNQAELNSREESALLQSQEEARIIREQGRLSAVLEESKKILALKQAVVAGIYKEALLELKKMPDAEYGLLMGKACGDLSGFEGLLVPAAGREKITKKVLAGKRLKNIKLSEKSRELAGGFLVQGRSFDLDHSFEAVLEKLRLELEPQILGLLFGKEKDEG
jgi:V/A-type H+/Na+-transporting ATPase subunit E